MLDFVEQGPKAQGEVNFQPKFSVYFKFRST
jgi:hypothetical protein